jgi:hypothetical protein
MYKFHSTYVGVGGGDNDYFVTLYVQCPPSHDVHPFNVADGLTQNQAERLASTLETLGDKLTLDDFLPISDP